jgi:peroxiredoxin
MHRAVDEPRAAGAPGRVLKVGDPAPHFALPDGDGQIVDSRALLAQGPLVVTFYRGRW